MSVCTGGRLSYQYWLNGYIRRWVYAYLNAAFTSDGRHLHPVPFRIIGDTMTFIQVMAAYSLHARVINSALDHHTVVLEPVEYSSSH